MSDRALSTKPHFANGTTIVAHDAGAANLLLGWLDEFEANQVIACFEGPARDLWQRRFPAVALCDDVEQAVGRAGRLVTGTGWQSDLEHRARCLARSRGIPNAAVIDHWVNYRERFLRSDGECLPDEVWVADSYARQLAVAAMPSTVAVHEFDNLYLARSANGVGPLPRGGDVLYVAEPIIADWGRDGGEFIALDFFMTMRERARIPLATPIRLRPHPSEAEEKYAVWIAAQGGRVVLDRRAELSDSLSPARWVAGCHSFAMVVALAAERTVLCTLPPGSPPCVLPHEGIVHLRNLL